MTAQRPDDDGPPVVGVFPRAARERRRRLFDTLEQALEVRFAGRGPGENRALSAAIVWAGHEPPAGIPHLMIEAAAEVRGEPTSVALAATPILDQRLRRLEVRDGIAPPAALTPSPREVVLASVRDRPLWVADEEHPARQRAVLGPEDLEADEVLRDRLCEGRFLALMPIVELSRRTARRRGWQAPPVRASFLLDDPNLHWPSYGHVKFWELAQDARRYGYHVGMATVPMDAWMVHPRARAAFRRHPDQLSLIIHGNEHVREELARPRSDDEALALARQALERAATLERRTGLAVARIMSPPHGVCSEQMASALLQTGFEALTISRAYPWRERPPANRPLAGWRPAEFVTGGLPVIERRPLSASSADLAILAYLDHPLVVFGHHGDLAGGPDRLRAIRDQLAALGPTQWMSVQRLARGNFTTRRDGGTLRVRLYGRRAELTLPEGVDCVIVDLPGHPCPERELVGCGTERAAPGAPLAVSAGGICELVVSHGEHARSATGHPRRRRSIGVWPIVRRGMAEARDRSLPVIDHLSARREGTDVHA